MSIRRTIEQKDFSGDRKLKAKELEIKEKNYDSSGIDSIVLKIEETLKTEEQAKIERATREAIAQSEQEAQAREKIAPLEKEYREKQKQEKFCDGAKYYYALMHGKKGYSNWLENQRDAMVDTEKVWAKMAEEYEELAGKPWGGHVPKTEEEMREYWLKPEYSAKGMMKYTMLQLDGIGPVTGVTRGGVGRPEGLIREMQSYRKHMLSKEYLGHEATETERKAMDNACGFGEVAKGVGLAALESDDTRVAARALAFAQDIEPIHPDELERFQNELSRLDEPKREDFATEFISQRQALREAQKRKVD